MYASIANERRSGKTPKLKCVQIEEPGPSKNHKQEPLPRMKVMRTSCSHNNKEREEKILILLDMTTCAYKVEGKFFCCWKKEDDTTFQVAMH